MALIPSREDILRLLDELNKGKIADDLESEVVDFKPWLADIKENQAVAVELAICFANSEGGVVVFGVRDRTRGRRAVVTGCKERSRLTAPQAACTKCAWEKIACRLISTSLTVGKSPSAPLIGAPNRLSS
jgi:hypothetical protein